ncbi:MAG: hypothetical protein C4545_04120 [Anaerolineaceae bacterium]|jgi:hypothetical protein|nr:MAG: hypothetical protein C4545_04120 [Anaerolineaceae bacterium]
MSKSDLEASLLQQIRWAGLPMPETEYRAIPSRRFRWDGAYPYIMLLYEVNGGIFAGKYGKQSGHTSGVGLSRDYEKNNLAVAAGWRVLYFTRAMIESGKALALLEKEIEKWAINLNR